MTLVQLAPGARVAVAQFHEINGPIKFSAPSERLDFANTRINLHKRAGAQQGIQGHVVQTDVSVQAVANIEMLDKRNWHFAPDLYNSREESGIVHVERAVKANGERDGALLVVDLQI